MSDRERWIIYPLLFLAVTIGAYDKMIGAGKTKLDQVVCRELRAQEIYCTELQGVSSNGNTTLVRLGTTADGSGEVLVYNHKNPQPEVVLRAGNGGSLHTATLECERMTAGDKGRSLVVIGANAQGGFVNARSRDGVWGVAIGHMHNSLSGMFGIVENERAITIETEEGVKFWGTLFPRPPLQTPQPPVDGETAPADAQPADGATVPEGDPESDAASDDNAAGSAVPDDTETPSKPARPGDASQEPGDEASE